jgi:CRISPR/Cas system type I-B associated protein Csh2 (Cas7 group RAMP superfamily)
VATVYRTDHTPRYTIRLDAAGLNPQIAHLLSFTNEDVERLERDIVTTRA